MNGNVDSVTTFLLYYAESFNIGETIVYQKLLEHVLSGTDDRLLTSFSGTARDEITVAEGTAREYLKNISSRLRRLASLRKSVVTLEKSEVFATNYERHSLALALYREEIVAVVEFEPMAGEADLDCLEEELEAIDRRKDALAVLASYFQGEQKPHRPSFSKFFPPLPPSIRDRRIPTTRTTYPRLSDYCRSTDSYPQAAEGVFDPLRALEPRFLLECDGATATAALSPLCVPLGLPTGYIHVRFLLERFRAAITTRSDLPSFQDDVVPVLNRLRNPTDQTILAEWCSDRYDDTQEKMMAIDRALESALVASQRTEGSLDLDGENSDLAAVKRITAAKSLLTDKVKATELLQSNTIQQTDRFQRVKSAIEQLIGDLNTNFWSTDDPAPESFVELVLSEASDLAARAFSTTDDSFAMPHMRHMSSIVHREPVFAHPAERHLSEIGTEVAHSW